MVEVTTGQSRLVIKQGDITKEEVEAIVNAANSSLMGGGGVDGAIHRAGGPAILEDCRAIVAERGPLPPGQAVITTAGNLPARYVIHTVGPVWHGGNQGEAETLASCYRESLRLAEANGLKTVAFPSISTGAYQYPVTAAAKVALETMMACLKNSSSPAEIRMVLFDQATYTAYVKALEKLSAQTLS
ncbi:MAG: O-acetyl-ADP-ribose deacetylase [Clostridia bacterium]|nr:MAG: O-acetyl-ADP-ribose deacetylase [Clostridia bacterium]